MDPLTLLQLSLWREACRHIDVVDSIADLAGAIAAAVPLDAMWVFTLSGGRCALAASWGVKPVRVSVDRDDALSLERFARRGGIATFNPSRPGQSLLRPLAPTLGDQRVICGALGREGQPEGVVAWRLARDAELTDEASRLLAATLEPLAVALDTSNRFHELESLRRAAEADRQAAMRRLGRESLDEEIIGARGGLRAVLERVDLVAKSDVPTLILGETGSGKEVIARAIHDRSSRREGPFIRVNCGAIPPELIDSQLFGHERGAFTGATDQRQGWFERADTGTLFLDEIGDLPAAAQVRLLRVIQEGALERVGGQSAIRVDCRIVAATHRDLAGMVRTGSFREDLWYRLAVFPIVLPPLRERREDLSSLADHFARRASTRFGLTEFVVTTDDLAMLARYDWPGNVRELAAVIDRAALLGANGRLALAAAMGATPAPSPRPGADAPSPAAPATLDDAIRAHIRAALERSRGKVEGPGGAAEMLAINPNTLRSKMRKLRVQR
ncbi:MAG: sigma-54-dependent Fis family transcriptional regulator [Phycisphaeraceae bacterium]|nr:sigma-54-dependent Fis family transcriptional regulator [Phycisphaeraceae bacterium]